MSCTAQQLLKRFSLRHFLLMTLQSSPTLTFPTILSKVNRQISTKYLTPVNVHCLISRILLFLNAKIPSRTPIRRLHVQIKGLVVKSTLLVQRYPLRRELNPKYTSIQRFHLIPYLRCSSDRIIREQTSWINFEPFWERTS